MGHWTREKVMGGAWGGAPPAESLQSKLGGEGGSRGGAAVSPAHSGCLCGISGFMLVASVG